MDAKSVAAWMQSTLEREGCIYQDDAVDYVVRHKGESLLRENADGNLALGLQVLNEFKKLNAKDVVWVKSDMYWRPRVAEDEDGRDARG
jgi:hypothetical protein